MDQPKDDTLPDQPETEAPAGLRQRVKSAAIGAANKLAGKLVARLPADLRLDYDLTDSGRVTSVSGDLMRGPRHWTNALLLTIFGAGCIAFAWAGWATLDEVTSGEGRVVPSSQIKLVQNLEGGIVSSILVREGAVVRKGQVLLRIDKTTFGASLREKKTNYYSMLATASRLKAEANGTQPVFPDILRRKRPDLLASETKLYESRRAEFEAGLDILRRQIDQRKQEILEIEGREKRLVDNLSRDRQELKMTRPLVAEGLVSKIELLRLETKVNDRAGELDAARLGIPKARSALSEARQRITEKVNNARSIARAQLGEIETRLSALSESLTAAEDRVARTDVRSPVRGIVKRLLVSTIGQVIQPGKDLAEIVPLEDTLLIEAKILPSDIAFLRPGLDAIVKITAYDFTLYGTLAAKVERVGADTITDDRGNTFYKIRVRTERNSLGDEKDPLPIIPGMVAQVDILTGKKSVLSYLLKPITRMRHQALRER